MTVLGLSLSFLLPCSLLLRHAGGGDVLSTGHSSWPSYTSSLIPGTSDISLPFSGRKASVLSWV